jgi:hypothetical protein
VEDSRLLLDHAVHMPPKELCEAVQNDFLGLINEV